MKFVKIIGIFIGCGMIAIVGWTTIAKDGSGADNKETDLIVVDSSQFKITLSEFAAVAATQTPMGQSEIIQDSKKRLELLDKLINMNLLAYEAIRRGYDQNPEVVTVKKSRLATLMHNRISGQIQALDPTEEDMRAYYQKNIDKYNKPEKVRLRHILLSNETEARALLNRLEKEEVSQYQFRKLAKDQSEDEKTRHKGGDLTFIVRDTPPEILDSKLVEAAFKIPSNGAIYSQLVQTEKGYHILMRTGYRKPMNLSFDEAKTRLEKLVQRQLHKEKVELAMKELQKKYNVQLFEENLKHVVIDLTKTSSNSSSSLQQQRLRR